MKNVEWALQYAERGWPVFPIHYLLKGGICSCDHADCERPGKHPLTANGLKDASTDPDVVRRMWNARPYANIGLATGFDNLTALDIDTDISKGKRGLESIRALEAEHGPLPPTLGQKTGSGGRHLLYKSKGPIKNSASKLGPDLDIRGVGGYIILPPSNHISGGKYEWLNELPIAKLPEYIETILTASNSNSDIDATADAPQKFSKKEVKVKLTLDEARILLTFIDCDERDVWWNSGAAMKSEFQGAGFAVWDEWSQGSKKYSQDACRRQWESFKEGIFSAGTLIKFAQEGGFRGFDEEVAARPEFTENWIWVANIKRFIELNTMLELDAESFDGLYSFNFKRTSASKAMLKNEEFPRVKGVTYWPERDKILEEDSVTKLNLWRPSGLSPLQGPVDKLLGHVEYLYPDQTEQRILLDYLSFQIQYPGEKVHWAVLLQGLPGNGKSYFGHLMSVCLGSHNVRMVTSEMMHDTFTEWQRNTQFVVVEEIMARGRMELMNKLKPLITQPVVNIQEKFKPTYSQISRYNFMFLTNHADALILDSTDRRYCVLSSELGPHPAGKDYYTTLFNWTTDNAAALLHYLGKRPLLDFEPHGHAPMTRGKREMIEESMLPLDMWIREKVDSGAWPFVGDIVNPSDIAVLTGELNVRATPKEIGRAFGRLGFVSLGRRYVANGEGDYLNKNKVYLWAVRNGSIYADLDVDSLRAAFASQGAAGTVPVTDGAGTVAEQRYVDNVVGSGKKPESKLKKERPM